MTRLEPLLAPVYPSIGFEELGRLLRQDGYALETVANADRPSYRTLTAPQFTIWLDTPFEPRPVVLEMQWRAMFAHFNVDRRDNLVVTQAIVVNDGVTAYYLKNQFWHWRQDLVRVRQVVRLSLVKHAGRVLH